MRNNFNKIRSESRREKKFPFQSFYPQNGNINSYTVKHETFGILHCRNQNKCDTDRCNTQLQATNKLQSEKCRENDSFLLLFFFGSSFIKNTR